MIPGGWVGHRLFNSIVFLCGYGFDASYVAFEHFVVFLDL
jgi:hypothetical protein